jgi:hypothetical protein
LVLVAASAKRPVVLKPTEPAAFNDREDVICLPVAERVVARLLTERHHEREHSSSVEFREAFRHVTAANYAYPPIALENLPANVTGVGFHSMIVNTLAAVEGSARGLGFATAPTTAGVDAFPVGPAASLNVNPLRAHEAPPLFLARAIAMISKLGEIMIIVCLPVQKTHARRHGGSAHTRATRDAVGSSC